MRANQIIVITRPVAAKTIDDQRDVTMPTGTIGTIVRVHENPRRYDIEMHLTSTCGFACATVEPCELQDLLSLAFPFGELQEKRPDQ